MISRGSRGPCDQCGKKINKGNSYERRVRYIRTDEKPTSGLARGRLSVAVHTLCIPEWSNDLTPRAKEAYQNR